MTEFDFERPNVQKKDHPAQRFQAPRSLKSCLHIGPNFFFHCVPKVVYNFVCTNKRKKYAMIIF